MILDLHHHLFLRVMFLHITEILIRTLGFEIEIEIFLPWLVWLSGLSADLRTSGSLVQFPVRAHARVAGQVLSRGDVRGNHTIMFLSLSFSFPSLLSKDK